MRELLKPAHRYDPNDPFDDPDVQCRGDGVAWHLWDLEFEYLGADIRGPVLVAAIFEHCNHTRLFCPNAEPETLPTVLPELL